MFNNTVAISSLQAFRGQTQSLPIALKYVQTVDIASATWNITHALKSLDVLVSVQTNGQIVFPASIVINDENSITVTFSTPITGRIAVHA